MFLSYTDKKRNRKFPVCRAILNFLSDYNEQDVTLRATKDVVSLFTDVRYLHAPDFGDMGKSLLPFDTSHLHV